MALGLFLNNRSPLPTRNYFPWLLQPLSGDLSGARGMFCLALIMISRTSKIPCPMRLLRHLLLSVARHSFSFSAQQVPGVNNQLADALLFPLAGLPSAGSRGSALADSSSSTAPD